MEIPKNRHNCEKAETVKPKWWQSDYSLKEKMDFLKYRIKAPKNHTAHNPILCEPALGSVSLSDTVSNFSIVFVGDIMPVNAAKLSVSPQLSEWLNSADALVVNLEGVITSQKRFLALNHNAEILQTLRNLCGNQIAINVANNHSSDFGKLVFKSHIETLLDAGFYVFGYNGISYSPTNLIHLHAASFWSNQPIDTSHRFHYDCKNIADISPNHSTYNIFLPHWGFEMEQTPRKQQIDFAENIVENGWDCIIGSHTHCPQPFHLSGNKPIAYSLGNFCYKNANPNHWFGRTVKLRFNIENGAKPQLVQIENYYTRQHYRDNKILICLVDTLDYQTARKKLKRNWSYWKDLIK